MRTRKSDREIKGMTGFSRANYVTRGIPHTSFDTSLPRKQKEEGRRVKWRGKEVMGVGESREKGCTLGGYCG
jgi:hypothetical protein